MAKQRIVCLSATANPFDPIKQEDSWRAYDNQLVIAGIIPLGCEEYLARIANIDDSMSEPEVAIEIERAVDEIVRVNPFNDYKKVIVEVDD